MRDDEKKVLLQQQIEQEIDFDKLTEFCEHLTDAVQEIFRSCGLYFRIFSRNIQQRYAENQKYLQNMGTIIYLKGSAATLIKRLEGSNNPTLEGAENKEDKIKKLLKQRDPVYEKFADIKVVTGVKPFDELIAEIEEKLRA